MEAVPMGNSVPFKVSVLPRFSPHVSATLQRHPDLQAHSTCKLPKSCAGDRLRVLFVSSEIYPLAKTGGLADVSAALPRALPAQGVDVQLMMPGYPGAQ